MREGPNVFLRVLVPVLLLVIGGGGLFWALRSPSANTPAGTNAATTTSPATTTTPTDQSSSVTTPGETGSAPAAPAAAGAKAYVARAFPMSGYSPIGSLEPSGVKSTAKPDPTSVNYQMKLEFDRFGAGVRELALANHYTTVKHDKHEVVQELLNAPRDKSFGLLAFAADTVTIDGVVVGLALPSGGADQTIWRETSPGAFEAIITDGDKDIARITRVYELAPSSYDFALRQTFTNLTDRAMKVVWKQFGPVDQPLGTIRYGGDVRRARFGYLMPPTSDPTGMYVQGGDKYVISHQDVLGDPVAGRYWRDTGLPVFEAREMWPNPKAADGQHRLSWAAMTSRYFVVAVYNPALSRNAATPKSFDMIESIGRVAIPTDPFDTTKYASESRAPKGYAALTLTSKAYDVAPGAAQDLSIGAYAGPMSERYIDAEPGSKAAGLKEIVIYTFGGPCGFCTFQPIAWLLRWFLGTLHDYVVFDWALAIMILVVCVRTILHPVTKWSQKNLARFGKQMSAVGPKMKALQDKYKNDPVKMREETARLMREENVNYAGMLGCLPTFLQTPIWIALYAMIYFTFELRQEGAFFGIVQTLTGGKWSFLGDLAQPDNFLNFHDVFGMSEHGIWIWGLSSLMGPIEGINVLPLVLGVVFFIQQKYLTPPTSATMTEEQKQQQKMMKVMTVIMFPLFMYNAPAALSVYFITNSSLAIVESKWIRKQVDAEDAERAARVAAGVGTSMFDRKDKNKKPDGWMAKLQAKVMEAQARMEEQQRQAKKKQPKK